MYEQISINLSNDLIANRWERIWAIKSTTAEAAIIAKFRSLFLGHVTRDADFGPKFYKRLSFCPATWRHN